MKTGTVEIPTSVLASVETLDELQDWLTAQHQDIMGELRQARQEDQAGEFKPWKPRHIPWPTESK
jgi:hypothetical protein